MNNDLEVEKTLLDVMRLNDRSDMYLYGCVVCLLGMIGTAIAAFYIGRHFLFLTVACWVLARFICIERGMECNRKARELLDSIK